MVATNFFIKFSSLKLVFDAYCEKAVNRESPRIPYQAYKSLQSGINEFNKTHGTEDNIEVRFEPRMDGSLDIVVWLSDGVTGIRLFDLPTEFRDMLYDWGFFPGADDEDEIIEYENQDGEVWLTRRGAYSSGWENSSCRKFLQEQMIKEKENDNMNTSSMMPKFDFGPVDGSKVRLSPYGMAIKNKDGAWVSYDAANGTVIQVDGFAFDMAQMIYKMPVAISQVKRGDMVIHNHVPMYVVGDPNGGNSLSVVDIYEGEAKSVMPTTNMFGFNFVTKVVSLMNVPNAQPDPSNPFGNIMPFLMMQQLFGDGKADMFGSKSEGMDFGKLMMMSYFMGGNNPFAQMFAGGPFAPFNGEGQ